MSSQEQEKDYIDTKLEQEHFFTLKAGILVGVCKDPNDNKGRIYATGNYDRRNNDPLSESPQDPSLVELFTFLLGLHQATNQQVRGIFNNYIYGMEHAKTEEDRQVKKQEAINVLVDREMGVPFELAKQITEAYLTNSELHFVCDLSFHPIPEHLKEEMEGRRTYVAIMDNYRLLTTEEDKRKGYMLTSSF